MRVLRVGSPNVFNRVREWRDGVHIGIAPGIVTYLVLGTEIAMVIDEVEQLADEGSDPAPAFQRGDFPSGWLTALPVAEGLRPASPEDAEVVSLLVSEDFLRTKLPAACREVMRQMAGDARRPSYGST